MPSSSAYIIEVEDGAAGVVVRENRGGFRFFAAQARFRALDGRVFGHPAKAERAARHLAAGGAR